MFDDTRSDGGSIKENARVRSRSDYNVNAPLDTKVTTQL